MNKLLLTFLISIGSASATTIEGICSQLQAKHPAKINEDIHEELIKKAQEDDTFLLTHIIENSVLDNSPLHSEATFLMYKILSIYQKENILLNNEEQLKQYILDNQDSNLSFFLNLFISKLY